MNPLGVWTYDLFFLGACIYAVAFGLSLADRLKRPTAWVLAVGLANNLGALGLRLYTSWPMQAPFQEPFWLPATLACLAFWFLAGRDRSVARTLIGLAAAAALFTAFFPKDYYLPFPRSNTILAHVFLLISSLSKAYLLAGGAAAGFFLFGSREASLVRARRALFGGMIVWGFVLYSLGLFIAQAWSYLGWASPVIFEQSTMTTSMGTWFYYGCFLHLFLLKSWPAGRRAWFALMGAPLMLYFNYLPETGQFKIPVFW
jgi:hypothetical protein